MNSSQSQRKKVLVVDDEKSILELLVLVLQDAGYEVIAANDGREAIVLALQEHPDVIILDILMPGLDGWETCDHLMSHEQTAGIPIIFLTARARPEDQLRGWYSGCFDYITKPFEVDQLLQRVAIATGASHEEVERVRGELRQERVAVLESEESDDDHSTARILGWSPSP